MTSKRARMFVFKLQRNHPNETNGAGHVVSLIVIVDSRKDTWGTRKYTVFCIIFYRLKQSSHTFHLSVLSAQGIPAITPELQFLMPHAHYDRKVLILLYRETKKKERKK